MVRNLICLLVGRLSAMRAERALAHLPGRLRRDVGVAGEPGATRRNGMIHAMDPALLRDLRDPERVPPIAVDRPGRARSQAGFRRLAAANP